MVLNARTSVPGGPPDRLRTAAVADGADRARRIAVVARIGRIPSGSAPGSAWPRSQTSYTLPTAAE